MIKEHLCEIVKFMESFAKDSAHDSAHIYRVLNHALILAENFDVNMDILVAACLLHDIGRPAQFADPSKCHAKIGSQMAYQFLKGLGWSEENCRKVEHCVLTHRFRKSALPETIEAKILFDADKLDVTGALGIARTLMYKGNMTEPIYYVLPSGEISDGTQDTEPSFFREYRFKLEKLYDQFYTAKGTQLALERREIAQAFYESLYREVNAGYAFGQKMLRERIESNEK